MITLKSARFDLTQEHIDNGERRNPAGCPVALCLREHLGSHWHVIVLDVIDCWTGDHERFAPVRARRPDEVSKFIKAFDSFGPDYVKPMSFELNFTPLNPLPA